MKRKTFQRLAVAIALSSALFIPSFCANMGKTTEASSASPHLFANKLATAGYDQKLRVSSLIPENHRPTSYYVTLWVDIATQKQGKPCIIVVRLEHKAAPDGALAGDFYVTSAYRKGSVQDEVKNPKWGKGSPDASELEKLLKDNGFDCR